MSEFLLSVVQTMIERFELEERTFRDETTLIVSPENIVEVCRTLHNEFDFNMLASQTAVDYWPQEEPRFNVVYQMHSLPQNVYLCLRVRVPGKNPTVPSIVEVFPNANWHEREIWDMFGIRFDGHPDMRRILMPYEWEGHPLRKDYPLGYEEVQFTFNFDEIDLRKPYVKE